MILRQTGPEDETIGDNPAPIGFDEKTMFDLFVSRTTRGAIHDDSFVHEWVHERLSDLNLRSSIIPVGKIDGWHVEDRSGNILHDSGRFFSITGLKVRHRIDNEDMEWDQPIIDQPEIGILGILVKRFGGILHFLLQAKEEPGNINSVQLAPTVQATYSNYTRAHGGKLPPFIGLFLTPPKEKVFFSKLQAEDGGRFLFKSNRNMVVWAAEGEATELPPEFLWLTLRQIGDLIKRDNLVNSCARSVLSCLI